MSATVRCLKCGTERVASDEELDALTVNACACGNGSYDGIDMNAHAAALRAAAQLAAIVPDEEA